eukprot:PhF_6_TR11150/c0_g2_i1/m.17977
MLFAFCPLGQSGLDILHHCVLSNTTPSSEINIVAPATGTTTGIEGGNGVSGITNVSTCTNNNKSSGFTLPGSSSSLSSSVRLPQQHSLCLVQLISLYLGRKHSQASLFPVCRKFKCVLSSFPYLSSLKLDREVDVVDDNTRLLSQRDVFTKYKCLIEAPHVRAKYCTFLRGMLG